MLVKEKEEVWKKWVALDVHKVSHQLTEPHKAKSLPSFSMLAVEDFEVFNLILSVVRFRFNSGIIQNLLIKKFSFHIEKVISSKLYVGIKVFVATYQAELFAVQGIHHEYVLSQVLYSFLRLFRRDWHLLRIEACLLFCENGAQIFVVNDAVPQSNL